MDLKPFDPLSPFPIKQNRNKTVTPKPIFKNNPTKQKIHVGHGGNGKVIPQLSWQIEIFNVNPWGNISRELMYSSICDLLR